MKTTIADPAPVKPLKSRSHRDRKHFVGSKVPDDINVSVLVAIALKTTSYEGSLKWKLEATVHFKTT
ncbi:hypothetical protein HGO34_12460 [Agrobacterium vitis]|uniref:Uncharacterized protein n=1 Tax=Agrobacterium vitis TaxID=373 RepID=A0AAE5AWL5_AGRVI|nr:hypothetical protein [Agrobacterium vitis]MCF1501167.1 hypothetical protein [Allorhizobium sp. Av2]MCM2440527.1 hypothetical protein [Agrobacterium vitis]MUZ59513.1 hypothetical protein [Agrobacterium vitis]MVA66725.1 hypothetical protein [Agrobacterium vitis]MVA87588.1 hypothetical protein [Agrobacterium vitis]